MQLAECTARLTCMAALSTTCIRYLLRENHSLTAGRAELVHKAARFQLSKRFIELAVAIIVHRKVTSPRSPSRALGPATWLTYSHASQPIAHVMMCMQVNRMPQLGKYTTTTFIRSDCLSCQSIGFGSSIYICATRVKSVASC